MARIRTIKPEFPQSESLGRATREARLLFILLFTVADDEGRTRGNSRMLASLLYPYDDDAPGLISGWLDELEEQRRIRRYEVDGNSYIQIENWLEHQKIDRPSKSKFPSPREHSSKPRDPSSLDQGRDQGSRIKEGTKERIKDRLPGKPGDAPRYPSDFEEFWVAFKAPPNAKKPDALKAWEQTAAARPPLKDLLAAVAGYEAWLAETNRKRRPNDQQAKQHAATWLRGEVWNGFSAQAAKDDGVETLRRAWGGRASPLVDEIGGPQFSGWFKGSTLKLGPPARIIVPKLFMANWINQHFGRALERHFGTDCRAEVAQPEGKKAA